MPDLNPTEQFSLMKWINSAKSVKKKKKENMMKINDDKGNHKYGIILNVARLNLLLKW